MSRVQSGEHASGPPSNPSEPQVAPPRLGPSHCSGPPTFPSPHFQHALVSNAQLAQVAQIRKFHLLTKELDHDDDEVTATMKVRRANIQKKYGAEIEGLYS